MIQKIKNQKSKVKERGFTIIETLVALSIFTTSILAIFAVVPPGLSGVNYVKNKLTASYLAEEAVDLVRAYRDNGNDLISLSTTSFEISIDSSSNIITTPCNTLDLGNDGIFECTALSYTDTNGFFYQNGSTDQSIFTRTTTVSPSSIYPNDEFIVSAKVEWLQGAQPKWVEYSTILTKWQ